MPNGSRLYATALNPLLLKPTRSLPVEMAVIGAGTIGPDIGYYLKSALPGSRLHLVDIAEGPLQAAKARLEGYAGKAVQRGKMRAEAAAAVLAGINYTTDYGQLQDCALVIEAATEAIPLKQKIFAQVEAIVGRDCVITSNTSSIPADRIFGAMRDPRRATVTHFFAPAWRSLPVEVISWPGADQAVVDWLCWFFAATGKAPIMTDNAICFMLDRIFDNWCNVAAQLLPEATAAQIDKVAEEFVFAGPFFVLNLANGNPIIVETNTLQMEEGEHYRPASILNSVHRWQTIKPGARLEVPDEIRSRVRDQLLGILFSQSFDIIDRGIGTQADLNFGCQVALGFRQGPLDIMADLGEAEVGRVMSAFAQARPGYPQPAKPYAFYQDFARHVLVDEVEGVKVVTIRRPQAMNALNDQVTDEILAVLQAHAQDPAVKGFVITGYGAQAFCAGADIGRFPSLLGDAEAAAQFARDCARVQVFMDSMSKPVVAAVNGVALGGGLEVAIRCHALVATDNARFGFPEITLGILPGIGGCTVPYRKWPQGAALFHQMLCLGKTITAQEALGVGMVARLAEDYPSLMAAAVEEVKRLAGGLPRIPEGAVVLPPLDLPDPPLAGKQPLSREAVAIVRQTIEASAAAQTLAQALEIGYTGFGRIACTSAAREGIAAFLEKRKPVFSK